MKDLFAIRLGFNEKEQTYGALVHSITDNKFATISASSIRVVMAKLNKLVRDKTREVKHFPIPEPKRIISLADARPSLVGANGRRLARNGS
jgi:hypothetical protein